MSSHPSREQVERWKNDPLEFINYLAQTEGFRVWPYQEEIFKHYCRGGDMTSNEITKENHCLTDVDNKLTVVELTFQPRKGWSLLSLFNEHVFDNYGVKGDDEIFDASHVHFFVNGNGFPYSTIVDFQYRLPAIKELAGFGDITLVYDLPQPLTNMRLTSDVMRALRTLEGGEKWTNKDGSLLSTSCIVDLIQQLHMRIGPSEPVDIKPGIYRHYKKGDYCVLGVALNHDTGARSVIYYRCDDANKQIWMRSPEEFQATVEWNGVVPRFAWVGEVEPNADLNAYLTELPHLWHTELLLVRKRINDSVTDLASASKVWGHYYFTLDAATPEDDPKVKVSRNGVSVYEPLDEAFIHNWITLYPDQPLPHFSERRPYVAQMLLDLSKRYPEDYKTA